MKRVSTLVSTCGLPIALVATMWTAARPRSRSRPGPPRQAAGVRLRRRDVARPRTRHGQEEAEAVEGATTGPSSTTRTWPRQPLPDRAPRSSTCSAHVPKGERVRIALYSFDRIPVANAIIAAHRRGVHIQMLLNDHWENRAMKMVRAALGTNRHAKKSFIYKCKSSCRDPRRPVPQPAHEVLHVHQGRQVRGRAARRLGTTSPATRTRTSGTTSTSCPATRRSSTSSSTLSRT